MSSTMKHNFQSHNYKRLTFCKHCDNLLVGVLKQGLRCKRCDVDVHEKCQADLKQPCIEMIIGHHNFRDKTYKQPTYCDHCKKLLVGFVNQGLRCTECGTNVHDKCQNIIQAECEKNQKRSVEQQLFATVLKDRRRSTPTVGSLLPSPKGSRSNSIATPSSITIDTVEPAGSGTSPAASQLDEDESRLEKSNLLERNGTKGNTWMKNYKMWIILIVVILLVIGIIVVAMLLQHHKKQ